VIDCEAVKRIGILYHPKIQKSEQFAQSLVELFKSKGINCWVHSSWDEEKAKQMLGNTDLMVSVGGDGTILRVSRIVFPNEIPIVGVNLGNLGFMTELEAGDASDKLLRIVNGEGWVEERAMLQVNIASSYKSFYALNDVVVGRGKFMRLINIDVSIDGENFTTYRADAVLIATATGSTAYSLAANGPIMYPESKDMILKAICPHLSMDKSLIINTKSKISLLVTMTHEAVLSMDGQIEEQLTSGDTITITVSPNVTRFLHLKSPSMFYSTLVSKLKGKAL
jgi:NAD+ kinase